MQSAASRPLRAVRADGGGADGAVETFDLLRRWRRFQNVNGLAETTIEQYGSCLLRLMWATLKPFDEITEDDLLDYLDGLGTKGSSRGFATRAFKSFFGWAFEGEVFPRNPARRLKTSKPKYGPAPYLDIDEITRLVIAAAWREPRRAWAIILMYSTGIRLRSAVSITPSDIRDGRLHVRIAKGSRPYSVPLNRMAQEAVAELSALSEDRLAAGPGAGTAAHPERLIGVADGSLWNWIHTAGIDAGLEVNPHKLRHSFATRLAEKQVHPRTIQDLMNHQDMSQLTRYITVADPSKRSAVDLLDEDF